MSADLRTAPQSLTRGPVAVPTPEERAAELVVVTPPEGAARAVELRGPGLAPVRVFHAPNPAVVRETAEALRAFAAAVIREAAGR
jgi:hypothetical protein